MGLVDAQPASAPPRAQALTPAELAWIALVPCAIVILAAIVLLGPPLGHALPPPREELWPRDAVFVIGKPEPVKHARYLIALLGPALLAAIVLAGGRRPVALRPGRTRVLVLASQALTVAFLVAATIGQRGAVTESRTPGWILFGVATLVVGAALGLLLLLAPRAERATRTASRLLRDTPRRRIAALAVAALVTAAWLSTGVDSDRTVGLSQLDGLMFWIIDDGFAVLNGLTPLADYHPLYAQLWPYPAALVLSVSGNSMLAFTLFMTTMSGLVLLAIYGLLRRIARSALLALALYLPFVATGFLFMVPTDAGIRLSNAQMLNMWPMRYGGAYVLAWLTARHLDGAAPRRRWALFAFAGLVAIDNLEFGAGAIAATVVAILLAQRSWSRRPTGRLAAELAGSFAAAALLVSLLTLARSGRLPDPAILLEFPRLFGVIGLLSLPMPLLGFHLAMYATFAAAIATAATRRARHAQDALLTGMLAWSGVFGLIAGSYFVGHSDFFKLGGMLSAWALALVLLVVVATRSLARRGWRRPTLAEAAILIGFGIAICSLAETPTPWSQAKRLGRTTPTDVFKAPDAARFVAERVPRGANAILLFEGGHRVGYEIGIHDVTPYCFLEAIVTRRQLRTVLDTARRRHAHELFTPDRAMVAAHRRMLAAAGFRPRARRTGITEWSDAPAG